MSEESVEKLFDSIYGLIDLREIFRKTSPIHELSDSQEEEVRKKVDEIRENLDYIQEDLVE